MRFAALALNIGHAAKPKAHMPGSHPGSGKDESDGGQDLSKWEALACQGVEGPDPDSLTWDTLEGITVKPLYTPADVAGLPQMGEVPGVAPFTRGRAGDDVCGPALDDPAICGLFHRRRVEQFLPQGLGRRAAGRVGRLRSGHPSRL
jgi:hypothetical protein